MKNLKTVRTLLLATLMALSALSARAAHDEAIHRAPVAHGGTAPVGVTAACASPRAC